MISITEEMRYPGCLCEDVLKYGVTENTRRYPINRQFVYR